MFAFSARTLVCVAMEAMSSATLATPLLEVCRLRMEFLLSSLAWRAIFPPLAPRSVAFWQFRQCSIRARASRWQPFAGCRSSARCRRAAPPALCASASMACCVLMPQIITAPRYSPSWLTHRLNFKIELHRAQLDDGLVRKLVPACVFLCAQDLVDARRILVHRCGLICREAGPPEAANAVAGLRESCAKRDS